MGKGGGPRLVPAAMLSVLVAVSELEIWELSPICPCTYTTMGLSGWFILDKQRSQLPRVMGKSFLLKN